MFSTTNLCIFSDKERARNFAAARAKKKEADGNLKPPFKPTSRLGETINKYPKQEPVPNRGRKGDDDDDEKQKRKSILPVFKPSGVLKSYPVRSIIEATCPIVPPAWIQESMIKTTTSYSI